jgi:hypothetical protein
MADNLPIDIIHSRDYDCDLNLQESPKERRQSIEHEQAIAAQEEKPGDLPPDGGYGWVCVACVFWINANMY